MVFQFYMSIAILLTGLVLQGLTIAVSNDSEITKHEHNPGFHSLGFRILPE